MSSPASIHCDTVADGRLAALVASGEAVLFTGAGFSRDARDVAGRSLPTSAEMAAELWQLLFPDEPQDDSTLQDLVDVALARAPEAFARYLRERLTVGDTPLPEYYARWLGAPWCRVYTLNVDDTERAIERQFRLPRPLRSISALGEPACRQCDDGVLDVVHLNGLAGVDAERATFSTSQYASRLSEREPYYEQLCDDLLRRPFVFVGTVLDETILWRHLELLRRQTDLSARPPSLLVTRTLPRARHILLSNLRIDWLQTTARDAAADL